MASILLVLLAILVHVTLATRAQGEAFKIELLHPDAPELNDNVTFTWQERLQRAAKSRTRRILADVGFANPLYSDYRYEAGYSMVIELGTPPVKYRVIADTGSDLGWIQCEPCVHCYKQNEQLAGPLFSPNQSSTYRALGVSYSLTYFDNTTTSGEYAADILTMRTTTGDSVKFRFVFGCAHNTSYGTPESAGLAGLGLGIGGTSLVEQLSSPWFSYCLVNYFDAPNKASSMLFGSAAKVEGPDVVTTPFSIQGNLPFYYLLLQAISVGNKSVVVNVGRGNIVIDSGSSFTQLPPEVFSAIVSSLASTIPYQFDDALEHGLSCYNYSSGSPFDGIPMLTFHFKNADLELPPENYIIPQGKNIACLAMQSTQGNLYAFGNFQQQNVEVSFDLIKNYVSFKKMHC